MKKEKPLLPWKVVGWVITRKTLVFKSGWVVILHENHAGSWVIWQKKMESRVIITPAELRFIVCLYSSSLSSSHICCRLQSNCPTMLIHTTFFNFSLAKQEQRDCGRKKKGDIGMSSADPPDRFDRSAGAAHVNQPCGENFCLWPVITMVIKGWSADIKLISDTSNLYQVWKRMHESLCGKMQLAVLHLKGDGNSTFESTLIDKLEEGRKIMYET